MNPPLNETAPLHPADYRDCCALIATHWQHGATLTTLAETLAGFGCQRDLLPPDDRAAYEVGARSWPWKLSPTDDLQTLPGIAAIRWLDDADMAKKILDWQEQRGGTLRLSITSINADIARALAQYSGDLELVGLTSMNRHSAQALAERPGDKGRLCLALGLTHNDIASLDALEPLWSRRDSIISLPAIEDMDDEAAAVLSRCQGTLRLPNLKQLSEQHATVLSNGGLVRLELDGLSATALSNETARGLCSGNIRELSLGAINRHVPALDIIAAYSWGILQLDGYKVLPLALAQRLQQSPLRHLKLNGLSTLDFATASALCGTERTFRLSLDGLQSLDDKVVGVLVSNKLRSLEIRNVTELSELTKAMLREFGNYTCPALEAG